MSNIQIGRPWRTDAEYAAAKATADLRLIFEGRHRRYFFDARRTQHVYKAIGPNAGNILYITENLAGRCTLKYADLLFGEALQVEPESGDKAAAEGIDRIMLASRFSRLCYDAAATAGWAGRAWWQIVVGDGQVRIESIAPEHVFPTYDIDGRTLLSATIKHVVTIGEDKYVRVIEHLPGLIRQEMWRLARNSDRVESPVGVFTPEQPTGMPGLLIWGLNNYSTGGVGATDYDGESLTLVDEINNRRSQIARVLDQHADPAVVALATLFDEAGNLKISGRCIAAEDLSTGDPVRYVTWNGELTAAAAGLASARDAYLGHQEVAPQLVGMGGGTSADSWKKYKLAAAQTLARVNRKRLYLEEDLDAVLLAAQQVEVLFAYGVSYTPSPVASTWSDGLPVDDTDEMQIITGYSSARLLSRHRALMWIHDGDEDIVAEEEAQLDAEAESSLPPAFQGGMLDEAVAGGQ